MNPSNKLLSDLVTFRTYAKYREHEQRRESFEETTNRSMQFFLDRYPKLSREITKAFSKVHARQVLPSMRMFQFAGEGAAVNNLRSYNCAFLTVDYPRAFAETLFLLLSGCGVGFSVQRHHVTSLPKVQRPRDESRFIIADTIEGWAQALEALTQAYFYRGVRPVFDYSLIRPKGARLRSTGAKAPGHEPLRVMLNDFEARLKVAVGRRLSSIECHDLMCITSDCVLAGGVRRSALISLFDPDDNDMLMAKSGSWWEKHPYRARANNSVVLLRAKTTRKRFDEIMHACEESRAGEPGIFWTNDETGNMGANPCQPESATVLTPEGIRTFADIDVGSTIWSGKQWTKVTKKWATGIKPVYDFKTRAGIFRGTENHKVFQNGERVEASEAVSIDNCRGPETETTLDPRDIMFGLLTGDGTYHHASRKVFLCVGEKDQDYFTSEIAPLISGKSGSGRCNYHVETHLKTLPKTYDREIPDEVFYGSANRVKGFLKGLYSANGTVIANRVVLKASSFAIIERTQALLATVGIRSYYTTNRATDVKFNNGIYTCRQSYDLNITTDRDIFARSIGFLQQYKNDKLTELMGSVRSQEGKTSFEIVEKEFLGEEVVYDITVEAEEHSYWTGGLLVSNCCEISLNPFQLCNLTTINQTSVRGEADYYARTHSATLLGTLQATLTDFPFLDTRWQRTTEREALLGVSFTGIGDMTNSGIITKELLKEGAKQVLEYNARYAKKLGINEAARATTVKPEGTASCVLGASSGIHARKAPYYIRRFQISKNDTLYSFLVNTIPDFIEDYRGAANTAVVSIPQQSPAGAVLENEETGASTFQRALLYNQTWVKMGHRSGVNRHNVSCTIPLADNEWAGMGDLMWSHRDDYTGLSLLPKDGGTYEQAPFEAIDADRYAAMVAKMPELDLKNVIEEEDETKLSETVACAGGACELVSLK